MVVPPTFMSGSPHVSLRLGSLMPGMPAAVANCCVSSGADTKTRYLVTPNRKSASNFQRPRAIQLVTAVAVSPKIAELGIQVMIDSEDQLVRVEFLYSARQVIGSCWIRRSQC